MLELKNICFDVQEGTKEIEIIRDVSFTIPDNKFVVITGPNGGGKSTLARLIAGIEKPTGGSILLDGEDITEKSITDRARMGISYAMQQPVRFKGIQVLDLLRLAVGKRVSVADACQYLSKVGLCAKDYIKREVNASLSGGELKRIEIATVLARGTKLSVFDEPEAGIDLWLRADERFHQGQLDPDHFPPGEDPGDRGRDHRRRGRKDRPHGSQRRDPAFPDRHNVCSGRLRPHGRKTGCCTRSR